MTHPVLAMIQGKALGKGLHSEEADEDAFAIDQLVQQQCG